MWLVRILYIPRTRPVAYCLSAADLACPLAEELIRTWLLAKTKKKMEWSNSRISYTICGKYDRHTYITMRHICDKQFSYNPKKHPKQKKKFPSEKAFLTTPICLWFLKPSEKLTQLSTSPMLTGWMVPVKSLCKDFTSVLFLLHPLRSFQEVQNQDNKKKRNLKTTMKIGFHSIWLNRSHHLESKSSINSKRKLGCKLQWPFSEETFFFLYCILAAGKSIRHFRQCFGIWSQRFCLTMILRCNYQKSTQYTTPRISSSWERPRMCSLL